MFIELSNGIVNSSLIECFVSDKIWFTNGESPMAINHEDYEKLRKALLPKVRATKADEPKGELTDLFRKINKAVGGSDRIVFSKKLQGHLNARLKENFTEELLLLAASNMMKNDFYTGKNDREWKANAEWLLKDPEHINRFLEEKKKRGMFNG